MQPAENETCLTDEQVYALVAGELSSGQQADATDHLDGCETCRRLVVEASRGLPEAEESTSGDRYEVIAELGRGGMGVVYRARDRVLQRDVALKLIRRELAYDAATRRRLIRESKVMARLRHPNVAQVYDAGMLDEQLYLAMELVEGTTLREWLAQERRTDEIVDCYRAAGAGLSAAHAAGLVHRDFKPDNVLVDGSGRPQVTDFGLARASDIVDQEAPLPIAAAQDVDEVTKTGRLAGTPAYMAPEQLDGRPIGPRADIFAFCVSLWEALYGERPFDEATAGVRREAIAAGELRSSRNRAVPRKLRRALVAGLSNDPADRPPSMDALLHELTRSKRWWPWFVVPSALVLGLLGTTTDRTTETPSVCPPFDAMQTDWPARAAEVRAAVARGNPEHSDLVWASARADIDGAIATLEQAHAQTCDVGSETAMHAQAGRRACIADEAALLSEFLAIAIRTGDARSLRAAGRVNPRRCQLAPMAVLERAYGTGERTHLDEGLSQLEALRLSGQYESTVERADALLAQPGLRPAQRARILSNRADGLAERGDTELAAVAKREAFQAARDAQLPRLSVLIATEIARAHSQNLSQSEAFAWLARAQSIIESTPPGAWREHLEAWYLDALGTIQRVAGNTDQSHRALSRALKLAQEHIPERVGTVLMELVSLHIRMGHYQDALNQMEVEELERWAETSWGKRSVDALNARFMHGYVLGNLGRFAEARTKYRAILHDARQVNAASTERACLLALVDVAAIISTPEQMARALADVEAVYSVQPAAGVEARALIASRCKIAKARGDDHRFTQCREAYDDALAHPEVPDALLSMVRTMVELALERGDPARALDVARTVDERATATFGDAHHEPPAVLALAEALLANGRAADVRTTLERLDGVSMSPVERADLAFFRGRALGPTPEGVEQVKAARDFWLAHADGFGPELANAQAWLGTAAQPQASPAVSHSQPQK